MQAEHLAAALVILTEQGIPADVQELLVNGNPDRGIPPGALGKALTAVRAQALEDAKDAIDRRIDRDQAIETDGWRDGMEEAWDVVLWLIAEASPNA